MNDKLTKQIGDIQAIYAHDSEVILYTYTLVGTNVSNNVLWTRAISAGMDLNTNARSDNDHAWSHAGHAKCAQSNTTNT